MRVIYLPAEVLSSLIFYAPTRYALNNLIKSSRIFWDTFQLYRSHALQLVATREARCGSSWRLLITLEKLIGLVEWKDAISLNQGLQSGLMRTERWDEAISCAKVFEKMLHKLGRDQDVLGTWEILLNQLIRHQQWESAFCVSHQLELLHTSLVRTEESLRVWERLWEHEFDARAWGEACRICYRLERIYLGAGRVDLAVSKWEALRMAEIGDCDWRQVFWASHYLEHLYIHESRVDEAIDLWDAILPLLIKGKEWNEAFWTCYRLDFLHQSVGQPRQSPAWKLLFMHLLETDESDHAMIYLQKFETQCRDIVQDKDLVTAWESVWKRQLETRQWAQICMTSSKLEKLYVASGQPIDALWTWARVLHPLTSTKEWRHIHYCMNKLILWRQNTKKDEHTSAAWKEVRRTLSSDSKSVRSVLKYYSLKME